MFARPDSLGWSPSRLLFATLLSSIVSCTPCKTVRHTPIPERVYAPRQHTGVPQPAQQDCFPKRGPEGCRFYEPRCSPDEEDCGPIPLGRDPICYDPDARRRAVTPPSPVDPSCDHDGECVVTRACSGNICSHFTRHPAGRVICPLGETRNDDGETLCGCVAKRCVAFNQ